MSPESKKIQQLKELFKLLNDSLTKDDFLKSFEIVIAYIKKAEENLSSAITNKLFSANKELENSARTLQSLQQTIIQQAKEAKEANETNFAQVRKRAIEGINDLFNRMRLNDKFNTLMSDVTRTLMEQHRSKIEELNDKILEIPQIDLKQIGDEVLGKTTPEHIRDKLETLVGEERLDKSAIKGLDELVKKENKFTLFGGSGGIKEITAGRNISIDNSSIQYPIVTNTNPKITVATTAPTSPVLYDLWVDIT